MNTKKSYEKYRAEFRVKKTKNGYDFSKLLSAVQKYIRRSECEKAIKCAIEADTFFELEIANEEVFELFKKETNTYQDKLLTDLHKIVKGIRTNFINRLIVIMSEEVNINDRIDIPIKMYELYDNWQKNRTSEVSKKYLIDMIWILCNAKKARLLSYLKSAYTLPEFYHNNMKEYYDFMNNVIYKKYTDLELRSRSENYNIETFIQSINNKNLDKTFRCLGEIIKELPEQDNKTIYKLFKSLWTHLKNISKQSDLLYQTINALFNFYEMMNHIEKPLYFYHAIALIVNRDEIEISTNPFVPQINYNLIISQYLENPIIYRDPNLYTEYFEEYILDIHTGKKKTLQSYIDLKNSFYIDPKKFNKKFILENYEDLYNIIKYAIGSLKDSTIKKLTIEGYDELKTDNVVSIEVPITHPIDISKIYMKSLEEKSQIMNTIEKLLAFIDISITKIQSKDIYEFPLTQQRTGKRKKFNRIDFDKKVIIKGPYDSKDNELLYSIKYNIILQELDKYSGFKSSWPWSEIYIDENNQYYLVSKFVSNNIMNESDRNKIIQTMIDKWSGIEIKYFDRSVSVVGIRISEIFNDSKYKDLLDIKLKQNILQHLYFRLILGIGDTGIWNMLYVQNDSDQIIAGIDLEEFRSLEGLMRETPYQILFNTSNNTYLHYFNEEMFKSITLINWHNKDLYDSLSNILDQEQIMSMVSRDNIYRLKIKRPIVDIEKNFDLQKNIDLLSQSLGSGLKMPCKKITFKGKVLNEKKR